MFRASSCPSSGEQYKADNTYGVQHGKLKFLDNGLEGPDQVDKK
jgi:hypothetical protein